MLLGPLTSPTLQGMTGCCFLKNTHLFFLLQKVPEELPLLLPETVGFLQLPGSIFLRLLQQALALDPGPACQVWKRLKE